MALAAREDTINKTLKNFARTEQMIYNPELWDSWTMAQYENAPAIDFFAYAGALKK